MAAKRRVHEVAKSLDRTSKELIALLHEVGLEAKAANSVVTPEDEARLRAHLFGIKDDEPEEKVAVIPELSRPAAGRARLRKKAPRAPEEEAEPAEPIAAEKAEVSEPSPEAPAGAAEAETPPEAPAEETAAEAPAKAEAEGRAEPAAAEEAKPAKGKGAPRPEKVTPVRRAQEEIEDDRGARVSSEALRRLAKSDRLGRTGGGRRAGKRGRGARPSRARRGVPGYVRGRGPKAGVGAPKAPPPKKKVRLRGEQTLGELALALDVPLERLEEHFAGGDRGEVTVLTVLNAEEQAAAAAALGFDAEAETAEPRLAPRRPVVTVLGHVDHGKTTLLDALRQTNVVATESGGITQHVGASVVKSSFGEIVFIDTPGHEVFTQMRARGARVTDLVVLVVAADDGVMPQTLESISHAKAAHVPVVVAITKVDKPEADPLRVKRGLAEHGVTTEDWGGEVLSAEVAAPRGEGLDKLLEAISLQSEIMELRGDPSARATGVILESTLDRGRGPVVTVLLQRGTLRVGDAFVAGSRAGRVRAMFDPAGGRIKEAGPATPATLLGAEGVPEAGEAFVAVRDDKTARLLAAHLAVVEPEAEAEAEPVFSLDEWYRQLEDGGKNELNLVVKGDVAGSVEALLEHVKPLGSEEVAPKILHAGVGAVNEGDVLLAAASRGVLVAYRVAVESKARALAQREGVEIRNYDVIYEVIEDVRAALEGLLEPEIVTEVVGSAEVREVFGISASAVVAGSMVTSGRVYRGAPARVRRDGEIVHEGTVASLRRFREDVKEVQQGLECGIIVGGFTEVEKGDVIDILEERKVARRLERK